MNDKCSLCGNWSDQKYLLEAQREPRRLEFWLQYYPDIVQASRSVCDNPPRFDATWKSAFPDPTEFRALEQRSAGPRADDCALADQWCDATNQPDSVCAALYQFTTWARKQHQ
jgi:hypothetical protein